MRLFRDKSILDLMQKTLPDKKKIVLLTIPDYSVAPQVRVDSNAKLKQKEIMEFNNIIREEGRKRSLLIVELFELAKAMGDDNSLVTLDGLHPSAKELKLWEEKIFPVVDKLLKE